MGIFGKKKSPQQRDEQQLINDNEVVSEQVSFKSDESSGGRHYEPPPTYTSNLLQPDSGSQENIKADPRVAAIAPVEILHPDSSKESQRNDTEENDDVKNAYAAVNDDDKNDYVVIKTSINKPKSAGCCATEAFEIEYELDRFRNIINKRKRISERLASFSYRWKSFRADQLANLHRPWIRERHVDGDDERTQSSGGSSNSSGLYENEEEEDENNSGVYQHFGRLGRAAKLASNCRTNRVPSGAADPDILASNSCNEYARRQFEVWRAAAIEGPRVIKFTAFVVTLILLLCAIWMAVFANREDFWTPGAIVACCHLVVASLTILLLESRSNLTGKGILKDVVTCGCSGKTVEDDIMDHRTPVLPLDAYQEYGDQHYSDDYAAKPRNDVVRNIRLFRYLHGRGLLYIFAGSMTFPMIPGHLRDYPVAFFTICVPGIILMVVGAWAFLAGVHSIFRWTLLETSIVGDDDHLYDKFISVGKSFVDASDENDDEMIRLNRDGFSILVTTLGLDLDETASTVFALEIRHKDPVSLTFEEFRKWWRGRDIIRRSRRSLGSRSGSGTLTSPAPSSSQGSLV